MEGVFNAGGSLQYSVSEAGTLIYMPGAAGGDTPELGMVEEVDPWNFAPRIKIPVLMLNGRNDFSFPLKTGQLPRFYCLGTPEKDKSHLLYEGGHKIFNQKQVFRDMLDWLDRYLGPASTQSKR